MSNYPPGFDQHMHDDLHRSYPEPDHDQIERAVERVLDPEYSDGFLYAIGELLVENRQKLLLDAAGRTKLQLAFMGLSAALDDVIHEIQDEDERNA